MINKQSKGRIRKRFANKTKHTVWHESDNQGGFFIFAGIKGTDIKTYAGSARSRDTLDYNMRKAKKNFCITVN